MFLFFFFSYSFFFSLPISAHLSLSHVTSLSQTTAPLSLSLSLSLISQIKSRPCHLPWIHLFSLCSDRNALAAALESLESISFLFAHIRIWVWGNGVWFFFFLWVWWFGKFIDVGYIIKWRSKIDKVNFVGVE